MIRALMAGGPHQVIFAETGGECLAILATRPVDLLITEVFLPGMDGLELTTAIRRTSDLPVIGMTAGLFGDAATYLRAIQAVGADAALAKPAGTELLPLIEHMCCPDRVAA